uniref:Proboscipedia n=1 Tax=Panagrolaimus sp. ES5 TaxID=591445 RepID=A0AC34GP42_9BILA
MDKIYSSTNLERSHEATKTEEVPKQYVYKKIESPRDYLNYDDDNYYAGPSSFDDEEVNKNEEKKENDEKMVEKNFKNDAKDEITLHNIQKGPEEAIISPPQVAINTATAATAGAFSHGQFTAPESHANQESPISFYARRVSIPSLKSGEQQQQQTTVPGFSSPPPPAPPPPPKSAIRIPTTDTTPTKANNENTKETKEKTMEATVKGGVSVIVPGLMDAAKESIERRKRGRTLSPENKNKIINSGPVPYRSPSVFGTSTYGTTTTATAAPFNNRINTASSATNNHGIVTRMNAQTPTSDTFLFRPRSQTARNIETTTQKTSEDFFHPNNHQFQQQQRMFSTSPTPSGTFLLGQSVFKPVNEVEKIRDNFNRKCESRGASVAGGYSRSPSVMSQSYYDGARDNYTPYRDSTYDSNALRHRFPGQTVATTNDYPTPYGHTTTAATTTHKWNIRNNQTSDDIFNRLPSGATRSKRMEIGSE